MRLLTVPNWSFGRDPDLLGRFARCLATIDVTVHYIQSDFDHNRTVTAFSGEESAVEDGILSLCDIAFASIDMTTHRGVHPRVGALDVCPLAPLDTNDESLRSALATAEKLGSKLAQTYGLPVFLYEKSERGRHEADLPALRRGGFENLHDRILNPDFGPPTGHPKLGATVLGVRDFLIAFNVNLATEDAELAKEIAREIRVYRSDGDPRFLGVRALGFTLASRRRTQVSINLTLPDVTAVDPIVDWIETRAAEQEVFIADLELIGVIRDIDILAASELTIEPSQILRTNPSLRGG